MTINSRGETLLDATSFATVDPGHPAISDRQKDPMMWRAMPTAMIEELA